MEYWVYLLPLCWMTVMAALGALLGSAAPRKGLVFVGLGVLVLLLGSSNFLSNVSPRQDSDLAPYTDLLAFADAHFQQGDLVISGPVDSAIGEGIIVLPFLRKVEVVPVEKEGPPPALLARIDERCTGIGRETGRSDTFVMGDAISRLPEPLIDRLQAEPVGELRGIPVLRLSRRSADPRD